MDLAVSAVILDKNNRQLIRLEDVLTENNKIFAFIRGEDIKKMKEARNLEFVFHIVGKGTITEEDYIDITGVRIVSNGGIHIEF